jgi:hypothetical protein
VSSICSRTTCLTCKRSLNNVKSCWKLILKVRENCSQDFISSPILHCWRFCHKVQNQPRFKKTSKNCLMPLQRSNSVNPTKKVPTKRRSWQSSNKQVVQKRFHWQTQSDVRD